MIQVLQALNTAQHIIAGMITLGILILVILTARHLKRNHKPNHHGTHP